MKTPNTLVNPTIRELTSALNLRAPAVLHTGGGRFIQKDNIVARLVTNGAGAGYVINSAGDSSVPASAFIPSNGAVVRIGHTTGVSDTLPTAAEIIAAVEPTMPNKVWRVGQRYQLKFINTPTVASIWTMTKADTDLTFINGSFSFITVSGNSGSANYKFYWITRASSTDVLMYEI